MSRLEIKDLTVKINKKQILTKVNAIIESGDTVAIMGPNGHGKSTLLKTIMGHYSTTISRGQIKFKNRLLNKMETDARARLGLYLASQAPEEIPGVMNLDFFKAAVNARLPKPIALPELFKRVQKALRDLKMSPELLQRAVNEGFSGGEKKKNEILQLKIINPEFAMLDEIDSGLDVDALKIITQQLVSWKAEKPKERTLIIVSHYERMFHLIKPNKVFVIVNGTIITTGDYSLAKKIDSQGYDWLRKEFKIEFKENKQEEHDGFILEDSLGKMYAKED
ncbi:Fe-S cluster assembly ATPase SufC [[Mycoplasma] testudinis]|uniref:Fe-S cluster assembly ATPase SufC n=1 Tax=[Mycoplasma] testudinis TaxID=33924 RepID=UPI0004849172|nr:Fe-S cluster assembly ATPase SufC [[Mycoplasma] testudinis]